jgi:signal transduction histidine kinase
MARLKGEAAGEASLPCPVDLRGLLADFVSRKQTLGVPVCLGEMPYAPMMAEVDRTALLNVLEHVVTNAVEAAPGRPVELGVHRAGDGLRISVQDRGGGMTQRFIRDELFRPLRSSKAAGLGIGAYQARQTMRDLKGDLEVSSTLGAGTIVQLVLPKTGRAA